MIPNAKRPIIDVDFGAILVYLTKAHDVVSEL